MSGGLVYANAGKISKGGGEVERDNIQETIKELHAWVKDKGNFSRPFSFLDQQLQIPNSMF